MHNVQLKLDRTYILIALVFCIVIIICIGKNFLWIILFAFDKDI